MASEFLTIVPTIVLAAFGWYAVHFFTSRRDRRNAERTIRISELSKAHLTFVRAATLGSIVGRDTDGQPSKFPAEFQAAIACVHLYGTTEQSRLASQLCLDMANSQRAEFTALSDNLRGHIRAALGLGNLQHEVRYLKLDIQDTATGKKVSQY